VASLIEFLAAAQRVQGTGKAYARLFIIAQVAWFALVVFFAAVPSEPMLVVLLLLLVGSIIAAGFLFLEASTLALIVPQARTALFKVILVEFLVWIYCRIAPVDKMGDTVWIVLALAGAFLFALFSTDDEVNWSRWSKLILIAVAFLFFAFTVLPLFGGWKNVTGGIGQTGKTVAGVAQQNTATGIRVSTPQTQGATPDRSVMIEGCEKTKQTRFSTPFTAGITSIQIMALPECWGQWFGLEPGVYRVYAEGQPVFIQTVLIWGAKGVPTIVEDGQTIEVEKAVGISFRSASPAPVRVTLKKEK
jgi:hypothetical protein